MPQSARKPGNSRSGGRKTATAGKNTLPLYVQDPAATYCRTCGRVVSSRHGTSARRQDYCSVRCRRARPGQAERLIERVFVAVLDLDPDVDLEPEPGQQWLSCVHVSGAAAADLEGEKDGRVGRDDHGCDCGDNGVKSRLRRLVEAKRLAPGLSGKRAKGDPRVLVRCGDVQRVMFPGDGGDGDGDGDGDGSEDGDGDGDSDGSEGGYRHGNGNEGKDDRYRHGTAQNGGGFRAATHTSSNGSSSSYPNVEGGMDGEAATEERESGGTTATLAPAAGSCAARQREGMARARRRELVRQAARRLVVFGVGKDGAAEAGEGMGKYGTVEEGEEMGMGEHGTVEEGEADDAGEGGEADGVLDKTQQQQQQQPRRRRRLKQEQTDGDKAPPRRFCEAVALNGGSGSGGGGGGRLAVVDPSFAKGDWAIRWRDGWRQ